MFPLPDIVYPQFNPYDRYLSFEDEFRYFGDFSEQSRYDYVLFMINHHSNFGPAKYYYDLANYVLNPRHAQWLLTKIEDGTSKISFLKKGEVSKKAIRILQAASPECFTIGERVFKEVDLRNKYQYSQMCSSYSY